MKRYTNVEVGLLYTPTAFIYMLPENCDDDDDEEDEVAETKNVVILGIS